MKKFLILFIAVFALCSCSKEEDNYHNNSSVPNIFGVYEISGVLNNSNINQNEPFVLYPSSSEYNTIWRMEDNKYPNDLGELYGGTTCYRISKYELNDNYLSLFIYNKNDNSGYIYKFVFKVETTSGGFILTCIDSELTQYLLLNRNDKIKLTYLGYNIDEWGPKFFN